MSIERIKTVMIHTWYHLNHSLETWIDLFWFPAIGTVVFGFTAQYFTKGSGYDANILLLGVILWDVVTVAQYSISVGALWEIWSKSFTTLFISPLSLQEFIVGQMIGSLIKVCLVFVGLSLIGLFYSFSIFQLGWVLLFYLLGLILFAWAAGMIILGLIFRFGSGLQSLAWGLIYLIQPLSGAYFPVDILPDSVRPISAILPPTYFFAAAREQYTSGYVSIESLSIGFGLNAVFLVVSYWFMKRMYDWSKETGAFARMEG